VTLSLYVD